MLEIIVMCNGEKKESVIPIARCEITDKKLSPEEAKRLGREMIKTASINNLLDLQLSGYDGASYALYIGYDFTQRIVRENGIYELDVELKGQKEPEGVEQLYAHIPYSVDEIIVGLDKVEADCKLENKSASQIAFSKAIYLVDRVIESKVYPVELDPEDPEKDKLEFADFFKTPANTIHKFLKKYRDSVKVSHTSFDEFLLEGLVLAGDEEGNIKADFFRPDDDSMTSVATYPVDNQKNFFLYSDILGYLYASEEEKSSYTLFSIPKKAGVVNLNGGPLYRDTNKNIFIGNKKIESLEDLLAVEFPAEEPELENKEIVLKKDWLGIEKTTITKGEETVKEFYTLRDTKNNLANEYDDFEAAEEALKEQYNSFCSNYLEFPKVLLDFNQQIGDWRLSIKDFGEDKLFVENDELRSANKRYILLTSKNDEESEEGSDSFEKVKELFDSKVKEVKEELRKKELEKYSEYPKELKFKDSIELDGNTVPLKILDYGGDLKYTDGGKICKVESRYLIFAGEEQIGESNRQEAINGIVEKVVAERTPEPEPEQIDETEQTEEQTTKITSSTDSSVIDKLPNLEKEDVICVSDADYTKLFTERDGDGNPSIIPLIFESVKDGSSSIKSYLTSVVSKDAEEYGGLLAEAYIPLITKSKTYGTAILSGIVHLTVQSELIESDDADSEDLEQKYYATILPLRSILSDINLLKSLMKHDESTKFITSATYNNELSWKLVASVCEPEFSITFGKTLRFDILVDSANISLAFPKSFEELSVEEVTDALKDIVPNIPDEMVNSFIVDFKELQEMNTRFAEDLDSRVFVLNESLQNEFENTKYSECIKAYCEEQDEYYGKQFCDTLRKHISLKSDNTDEDVKLAQNSPDDCLWFPIYGIKEKPKGKLSESIEILMEQINLFDLGTLVPVNTDVYDTTCRNYRKVASQLNEYTVKSLISKETGSVALRKGLAEEQKYLLNVLGNTEADDWNILPNEKPLFKRLVQFVNSDIIKFEGLKSADEVRSFIKEGRKCETADFALKQFTNLAFQLNRAYAGTVNVSYKRYLYSTVESSVSGVDLSQMNNYILNEDKLFSANPQFDRDYTPMVEYLDNLKNTAKESLTKRISELEGKMETSSFKEQGAIKVQMDELSNRLEQLSTNGVQVEGLDLVRELRPLIDWCENPGTYRWVYALIIALRWGFRKPRFFKLPEEALNGHSMPMFDFVSHQRVNNCVSLLDENFEDIKPSLTNLLLSTVSVSGYRSKMERYKDYRDFFDEEAAKGIDMAKIRSPFFVPTQQKLDSGSIKCTYYDAISLVGMYASGEIEPDFISGIKYDKDLKKFVPDTTYAQVPISHDRTGATMSNSTANTYANLLDSDMCVTEARQSQENEMCVDIVNKYETTKAPRNKFISSKISSIFENLSKGMKLDKETIYPYEVMKLVSEASDVSRVSLASPLNVALKLGEFFFVPYVIADNLCNYYKTELEVALQNDSRNAVAFLLNTLLFGYKYVCDKETCDPDSLDYKCTGAVEWKPIQKEDEESDSSNTNFFSGKLDNLYLIKPKAKELYTRLVLNGDSKSIAHQQVACPLDDSVDGKSFEAFCLREGKFTEDEISTLKSAEYNFSVALNYTMDASLENSKLSEDSKSDFRRRYSCIEGGNIKPNVANLDKCDLDRAQFLYVDCVISKLSDLPDTFSEPNEQCSLYSLLKQVFKNKTSANKKEPEKIIYGMNLVVSNQLLERMICAYAEYLAAPVNGEDVLLCGGHKTVKSDGSVKVYTKSTYPVLFRRCNLNGA